MLKYYEKQIAIPSLGTIGQEKFLARTVVIIGCGGLCAGVLPSVAGMGCAKLILVDGDRVEESNLHRQSIHGGRIGMAKATSAKIFASAQNKYLDVEAIDSALTMENAKDILRRADLVFDCTDNLPSRRLISDAVCSDDLADRDRPVVSGSALKLSGQILLYNLNKTDSYRTLLGSQGSSCSVDDSQQDCSSAGVFGPIPQLIGHLMAIEGAKILLGWHSDTTMSKYNFIIYDMRTGIKYLTLKERASEAKTLWDANSYARGARPVNVEQKSWRDMVEDESLKICIDVRQPSVRDAWPAPCEGAINIPLDELIIMLTDIPKLSALIKSPTSHHLNIYLFCQRGVSCMQGAALLLKKIEELAVSHPGEFPLDRVDVFSVREGVMNLSD